MRKPALMVGLLLGLMAFPGVSAFGQGVIHGIGDPRTLTPPPNCAKSPFYVDDSSQQLYIAQSGSPCVWGPPGGGASYAGVTSDSANGLNVAGNVNAKSLGTTSTATVSVTTPNNAAVSVQPLHPNFLRETHNQWALAGLQNSPLGSIVNLSQYAIGTSYTITAWSSSATTGLVTFTTSSAPNVVGIGLPMLVSGLTTGTLFNNQIGIVVSNPIPTATSITLQFPFRVTTSSATEAGAMVIQGVQLGISQLLDSTAQFHSGEQICQMGMAFPGANGTFAGATLAGSGVDSWGGWSCAGGGFAGTLTTSLACFTDGISACAPNGGTPLPFDFVHFPNGEGWVIYDTGSLTTPSNTINKMGWLFETDPGSGTYTIQTNNNGAGFVTAPVGGPVAPTGSATGAVGTGIAYMTAFSAAAPYTTKITSTGGKLYVWQVLGDNTLLNGVVAMSFARGGLSLGDYGVFPVGIMQTWNEALQPHLMFYEAKNNGSNDAACAKGSTNAPSTFIPFQTLWNNVVTGYTGAPTLALMDIVAIGSYDVGQICVPFDNDVMRNSVAAMTATVNGTTELAERNYFDGYYQSTTNQMQSSLLNQTTSGNVHSGVNQQGAVGDALAQYLGYYAWPNSTSSQPVNNRFTTTLALNIPDLNATSTGNKYALQTTPSGSRAVGAVEIQYALQNLNGTGLVCFGTNFVGCPANSTQFFTGGFTSFGTGASFGHFGFSGTQAQLNYDSTGNFVQYGYSVNINNANQLGVVNYQIGGVNYWNAGTNGNCSATSGTSYTLCDKQNSKPVIEIPSNTLPAKSYSGNANGASFLTINTNTNCSSSASPAVCAAAASGSVVVAAAATTVQVNTTAVTANSQIYVQEDSSLGTKLSVTCNTTPATAPPTISARAAATSFTITTTAPTTNPRCFSYTIVN